MSHHHTHMSHHHTHIERDQKSQLAYCKKTLGALFLFYWRDLFRQIFFPTETFPSHSHQPCACPTTDVTRVLYIIFISENIFSYRDLPLIMGLVRLSYCKKTLGYLIYVYVTSSYTYVTSSYAYRERPKVATCLLQEDAWCSFFILLERFISANIFSYRDLPLPFSSAVRLSYY